MDHEVTELDYSGPEMLAGGRRQNDPERHHCKGFGHHNNPLTPNLVREQSMKVKTFSELIEWTRQLHEQLAAHLSDCATKNEEIRAKALLQYLADHETRIEKVVAGFERQADPKAMKTHVYDYMSKAPIRTHRTCDIHCSTLGFEDISREVLDFHSQVIELYRTLAGKADTPAIKNLISPLLEMEEHQAMRLAKQTGRMADL
ncbi:MAG: ATPase [Wenzhouxiangellaceae bacterium]